MQLEKCRAITLAIEAQVFERVVVSGLGYATSGEMADAAFAFVKCFQKKIG